MGGLGPSLRKQLSKSTIQETIAALSTGEGSTPLSASVKSISFSYVARNSQVAPRKFLSQIAPKIAYNNPQLPFVVQRIPDPRVKSLDPNSPHKGAEWTEGMPTASMTIAFHDRAEHTIPLRAMSYTKIWDALNAVAGEGAPGIEAPSA